MDSVLKFQKRSGSFTPQQALINAEEKPENSGGGGGDEEGEVVTYDQRFTAPKPSANSPERHQNVGPPQSRRRPPAPSGRAPSPPPRPPTLLDRILKYWIYIAAGVILLIMIIFLVSLVVFHRHYTVQLHHYTTSAASGIYPHNQTYILSLLHGERLRLAEENLQRRTFVRDMIQNNWRRLFDQTKDLGYRRQLNLLAGLSTLLVANLDEEFQQGRSVVLEKTVIMNQTDQLISVSELVAHYLGGLLACYAITEDDAFLNRSQEFSRYLSVAYDTPTGLPLENINLQSRQASGSSLWLSEVGGDQLLEYIYLAHLNQDDSEILSRVAKMRAALLNLKPVGPGLYLDKLGTISGEWLSDVSTFGRNGRLFYSWLAKVSVQVNGSDSEAHQTWYKVMKAMREVHVAQSEHNRGIHVYVQDVKFNRNRPNPIEPLGTSMEYHACGLGATIAIGLQASKDNFSERESFLQLADQITKTCRDASNRTRSGLAPYKFYFDVEDEASNSKNDFDLWETGNLLNPELAESYFILWRTTHEQKYRNYAWEMARALYAHCQDQTGPCAPLENVNLKRRGRFNLWNSPTPGTNPQPAHLLGGTLKYLYLIFAEDDVLPIDKWIFNSVGQPLPIFDKGTEF